jgi:hypothetical protein
MDLWQREWEVHLNIVRLKDGGSLHDGSTGQMAGGA